MEFHPDKCKIMNFEKLMKGCVYTVNVRLLWSILEQRPMDTST